MPIKQSVCYPVLNTNGLALDVLFGQLAHIGYAAIELLDRPENFAEVIACAQKHGLAIASMSGHMSLTEGLNNPANHDRIEAELRTSIALAAEYGIPGLLCLSGNRQPQVSEQAGLEATVACLRRVATYAEAKGVNLNLELINSRHYPGYQCDHTAWGLAVCQQVNSPRVKLLYDIYHMQIMEGDIIRTIREHITWIGHFHVAGNPGRGNINDDQELNYRGICKAIAETGYDLYVGQEFIPKGDVILALQQAFAACDQ